MKIKATAARKFSVPTFFETSELPALGWITITDTGEENIYFTLADGTKGFCKP